MSEETETMSILTPSTTPHTRQVWPRLPKPGEPEIVHVPREQRQSVTLDEVQVGDTLSFLTDGKARDGVVVRKNGDAAVLVQTPRGRVVLTKRNWERRAPRR